MKSKYIKIKWFGAHLLFPMGFAAFTYLVLLVLRISAAHLFAREYTGYIKEFIVLTFVIVGVLSLFRYSQTLCNSQRDKKNLLQNRAFLLLNSIAIAVVVDHTFNDKHSNFTGPLFSDLYDITNLLCMLSLVLAFIELVNYALFKIWTYYLKLIEAKSKKGEVKGENQKNCNDVGSDQKEQKFSTESSLGINGKDVLNREPFAEHVASAIIKHTDQKTAGSLTIGLYGPWGSGKTSIFDMMERKFAEKDVNPVIIRFQPWFFGKDYMNLIPEFLNKLIDAIREHSLTYDPGLIRILKTYRKYLTPISLRPPGLIINFKDFFGHSEFSKEYTEAEELREQIIERLKLADIKLIVFIDDLDRLDNKEIQMIFKLVRMIADFPKITYVIAMDEEIVTNSLAQMYSKEFSADVGKNYLEKFIQIPLYIPSPDPILLANLGWELLEPVLDKEWGTANQQQIKNILIEMETSPRNLQRLSNICKVYMPLMGNDVHKLDLFSLLTIKVSTPGLFDFILKHADFFLGKVKTKEVRDAIFNDLSKYSRHLSFLKKIFPLVGVAGEVNSDWILQKRLGSPEHFWTYFMYSVPSGKLSESDYESLNDTLDRNLPYLDIAKVYNNLSSKSNSYALNKSLKERMAVFPVERKLRLLSFIIIHFHEEYKEPFQNQLHRSLIIELLVDLSSSPEVDAVYKLLMKDIKNWSLVGEVYTHKFGKTLLNGQLKDFFEEDIKYDFLIEHSKEDIEKMFTVWFEAVSIKQKKRVLTSWAKEHGVSSTVRFLIKDSHLQEDYVLLFMYVNILKSIPLKLIKDELKEVKKIDSLKAAIVELKNTDQPQLVILSYMDNCIYDYVLKELNEHDYKAKLKDDFNNAVMSLCMLGNSVRISEIRNKLMEIRKYNRESPRD